MKKVLSTEKQTSLSLNSQKNFWLAWKSLDKDPKKIQIRQILF